MCWRAPFFSYFWERWWSNYTIHRSGASDICLNVAESSKEISYIIGPIYHYESAWSDKHKIQRGESPRYWLQDLLRTKIGDLVLTFFKPYPNINEGVWGSNSSFSLLIPAFPLPLVILSGLTPAHLWTCGWLAGVWTLGFCFGSHKNNNRKVP